MIAFLKRCSSRRKGNPVSSLRTLGRNFLTVVALLCMAGMMAGQSAYGVILGTVTDASGAGVAKVRVTITNTDENTSRELTTNSSGEFDRENLLPAHYQVSITSKGFATYTATGLLLVARQTLRVDATLQVGQTQQAITVNESGAGVIATDSQVIQASFDP